MSLAEISRGERVSSSSVVMPADTYEGLQQKVEGLAQFFDFHNLQKPSTTEEKAIWKTALDEAYGEITAELTADNEARLLPLITKILTYNAHRLYGGDMNLTRLFFLTNLSLQLSDITHERPIALDYIKEESTLDGLAIRMIHRPELLNNLQAQLVGSMDIAQMISLCADEEALFDLAANLDWLGRCCQNLVLYNQDVTIFKNLYGAARAAYTHLIETTHDDTLRKNANWQMADNLYNTERHVFSLEHPNDLEGKIATLKQLIPYLEAEKGSLRAVTKAAQVQNIAAIEMWRIRNQGADIMEKAFKNAKEALSIAQENESKGFDKFLLSMFYNNVASFGIDSEQLTPEQAAAYSDTAIAKALEQGLDHYYFGGYFNVGARIARALGNHKKAVDFEVEALKLKIKFGQ